MGKGNPNRRQAVVRRLPNTRNRTRLQKPKLADPEQNSHDLAVQLRSLGLYAANTIGDGNCLFRALCDQLYGSPKEHLILRRDICDWMELHREHYQGFVEDGRSWGQHINSMREHATYGGHLELSAFAHLKRRNVKVIQPGLVYVIEWSTGPNAATSSSPPQEAVASSSTSSMPSDVASSSTSSPLSSREERKARRDRMREAKDSERIRTRTAAAATEQSVDGEPEESTDNLPAVYVAYHDWEHFSSVRNLTGPHQGIPNVVESPAPEEAGNEPPSPPSRLKPPSSRSKPRSLSPATTTTTTATTTSGSTPSSAPPQTPPESVMAMNAASAIFKSRSPKRSFEESEEGMGGEGSGSEYGRADTKRTRNKPVVREEGDADDSSEEEGEVEEDLMVGDDEEDEALGSVASSSQSQSQSRSSKRSSNKKKKAAMNAAARPKPKRVILLVGKKKDREKTKAKEQEQATEKEKAEWMSNGRGKMDVRGFRELKI